MFVRTVTPFAPLPLQPLRRVIVRDQGRTKPFDFPSNCAASDSARREMNVFSDGPCRGRAKGSGGQKGRRAKGSKANSANFRDDFGNESRKRDRFELGR